MDTEQKKFAAFAEIVAGLAIILLLPATLYQGVQVFMTEPNEVKQAREEVENLKQQSNNLDRPVRHTEREIDRLDSEIRESKDDQIRTARQKEIAEKKQEVLALEKEKQSFYNQYTKLEKEIISPWLNKKHQATFATFIIAGALLIVIGLLVKVLLGSLFVLGGGLSIAIGYTLYWDSLTNFVVFLSLVGVLALLSLLVWYYSRKK